MQVGELFVRLGLDSKGFDSGIDRAKQKSESAVSGIGSKLSSLAGVALKVGTVVGGALTAIGGFGVKYNADMEQTAISFKTLLGDGQKANQMIADLKKMGADTPFEFEGLANSAKLMLAMGFNAKDTIPNLYAVGDAVSAIGGSEDTLNGVVMALGQMKTKGKISAEEMNQLAERGIDAWGIMAEQMGKSKEQLMKMSQQGELMADKVLPKLIDGMGKKYKGAMLDQSKTFNGMLSTFKDNVKMLLGDATKPIFDGLKERLKGCLDLLDKWGKDGTLKAWADGIAFAITAMWDIVGGILGKLADGAKLIADEYKKHKPQIESFFNAVKDTAKDASNFITDHFVPDVQKMAETVSNETKKSKLDVEKFGETLRLLKSIGRELWDVFGFLWNNTLGVYLGQAIDGAKNAINGLIGNLNNMLQTIYQGMSAIDDLAHKRNPTAFGSSYRNAVSQSIPDNMVGGAFPWHAQGTSFFSGGLTWVGERGAELVKLPMGSQIMSNSKSMQAMAQAQSAQAQNIAITLQLDKKVLSKALFEQVNGRVRMAGGV